MHTRSPSHSSHVQAERGAASPCPAVWQLKQPKKQALLAYIMGIRCA